jgi:uncharacterized protein with PIN domain
MRIARLQMHGCARDLLRPDRRDRPTTVEFELPTGLRDLIQSTGVPHVELGTVHVNGMVADYSARVDDGDVIEAWSRYPLSEPPEDPAFLLDVHLGRLAHYLRLFGFNTEYGTEAADADLAARSVATRRILLTRDRGLLMRSELQHASFIRATDPHEQIVEVLSRFALAGVGIPLTRCLACNGRLQPIPAREARPRVPGSIGGRHDQFSRCVACDRIYWKGSHHRRLRLLIDETLAGLQIARHSQSDHGPPGG